MPGLPSVVAACEEVGAVLLRVGGVAFLLLLVLWLYCLMDAITTEKSRVRRLPKGAWIVIILLTFEIGAVAWLALGRPRREDTGARRAGGAQPRPRPMTSWPTRPPRRTRPVAPDDDPDFLAKLGRDVGDEQRRRSEDLDAELRRHEEELRGLDSEDDGPDGPERRGPDRPMP
jgi:Phospholipase_D-nuclease N-terminal